ncbi:MAG: hypothetical protein ABI949_01855 [Ilumatobacteraceae bacterium]
MEDLTIEDLIINVIDDPTPNRVSCQPVLLEIVPSARRSLRSVLRAVVRRFTAGRS